jgi:4-methyl-5(b-hydroxyethyl)-thiazole monophosphate biosynthesis
MTRVLVLLASGFEEIEATTIIDVLRRAELDVTTAALEVVNVRGAHGITLLADCELREVQDKAFDAVILPGGMPGSRNLRDDVRVISLLQLQAQQDKYLGAICAAPIALEAAGVLKGKRATSYPGYPLPSAQVSESRVVVDGKLVTSRGPGTALEFSLEWVKILVGVEKAEKLRQDMIAR